MLLALSKDENGRKWNYNIEKNMVGIEYFYILAIKEYKK
jgi:hypothetical protein